MNGADAFESHYREGPYREFAQEHRRGGTFGLSLMDALQGAGEFEDPPLDIFCFVINLHEPTRPPELDFGDGWISERHVSQCLTIQPPDTHARFRVPAMHVRAVVTPTATVTALLEGLDLPAGTVETVAGRVLNLPRVADRINRMWAASRLAGPAAALELDGAFLSMMSEVVAASGHGVGRNPVLSDRRLARAVDYIETHIAAPLTVGELASAAAMSPSAFSRAFRAATGETPWAHVQRCRLERAGERMARTEETLAEIAAACGFADASHFARSWRRAHGTTPRGS